MLKTTKKNSVDQRSSTLALKRAQKKIQRQALLAACLIFMAVVIVFAATAAWYTNIAQTSGLVFEVEEWGFDGTVALDDSPIQASPGDEGIIGLTAVNRSDNVTAVSVNVNKVAMPEEIQQRIFFYVDITKTRNGEAMERVYLNNFENYTYTLFGNGELILSERAHNAAQIKWEWVYDVLGYYMLGTWDPVTGMTISEYLRPIEYDYDPAATTFDAAGNLLTIDGRTTPMEYLSAQSYKDGYSGTASAAANEGGYYAIDVDGRGYGVWAYFCTYSEIQDNTKYDTYLASMAEKPQYTAKITVSAQNSNIESMAVNTAAAMLDALESGGNSVFTLVGDIALPEALVLNNMEQVLIDLNGNTLTADNGIRLEEGSSLTVYDGEIRGSNSRDLFTSSGAELTMSNVTVSNVETVIRVEDNGGTADSSIRIVNCDLESDSVSLFLRGNGKASAQKTQVVVENSSIRSDYVGILGNGTETGDGQWGTDVQIIGSDIYGYWAGIYQPQKNSITTISGGSVISGCTGIAIKGGTVELLNSTVYGTGAKGIPSVQVSGFCDTGDAIYIETNYGYEIVVEADAATALFSTNGYQIQTYYTNASNAVIKLSEGSTITNTNGCDSITHIVE